MYCPQCGNEVTGEYNFCPVCGCMLAGNSETATDTETPNHTYTFTGLSPAEPSGKKNRRPTVVFAAICIAVVLLAIVLFVPFTEEGSLAGKSFSMTYADADGRYEGGSVYITEVSGFVTDGMRVASVGFADGTGESDLVRISLSDTYSDAVWKISGYSLGNTAKKETATGQEAILEGYYGACSATFTGSGSDGAAKEFTFVLEIGHHRSYSWKYDGGRFAFDVCIDHSETYDTKGSYSYLSPSPYIVSKQTMSWETPLSNVWSNVPDFVVVTDTVQYIADTLGRLYTDAYGEISLGQRYADFILSFVQICFGYDSDEAMYGHEEYFAFPLQTIYLERGDCEDTSILAAAIYKAAGFGTAVCILPGHAVVGVALENYDAPSVSSSGEILKQTVGGKTYYGGETTVDSYQELGIIAKYTDDSGHKSKYSDSIGTHVIGYGTYGFYPVGD